MNVVKAPLLRSVIENIVVSAIRPIGFLSTLAVVLSCSSKDNLAGPDEESLQLRGKVLDPQGTPAESVGVHFIFVTGKSPLAKLQRTFPSTLIQYSIPRRTFVSVQILRWYTREWIATLVEDTVNAGTYSVGFNTSSVTNGLYLYRISFDSTVIEKVVSSFSTDVATLVESNPLTATNAAGEFSLPYGVFGFGYPIVRTTVNPAVIETVFVSRSMQLILYKKGYETAVVPLTIDTANEMRVTLFLKQ